MHLQKLETAERNKVGSSGKPPQPERAPVPLYAVAWRNRAQEQVTRRPSWDIPDRQVPSRAAEAGQGEGEMGATANGGGGSFT